MDKMAIAIQQPSVQEIAVQQSVNGVVNNAGDEQKFGMLLKAMQQQAKQTGGQNDLEQMLKKSGEENAQELAAQLMAQNPLLLAMLMANPDASAENLQALLSQTTQQIQGVTGEAIPNIAMSNLETEQPVLQTVTQEAFNKATLQTQQTQNTAQAQPVMAQQTIPIQQVLAQAEVEKQTTIETTSDVTQNENPQKQTKAEGIQIAVAQPTEEKQQPQQLAEKADFEVIAKKIKLESAKASQGEAKQQDTEDGGEKNSVAKDQKLTDSGVKQTDEQAVQVNFEKQIINAPPLENKITVKNQGSQEIIRQTVEGIKQNVAEGKEEFVMKLTPQGLGEITVKLVSENGHTTMQLTAQNQSVQRILGAELEALQQAVKPYNVEVKEVNTANQSQLDMNMSNQNGSQQQYQNGAASFFYNQQQGKNQYSYQGYLNSSHAQEIAQDESVIVQTIIQSTAINLHI